MAESRELGTLIVVVGKARNLPDKSRFGKQDPFCTITVNEKKQRTKAIKRGGQHPEWDEEFRFTIMEDVEDVLFRSESQPDGLSASTSQVGTSSNEPQQGVTTTAALANKSRKGPLSKKGGKSMKVACWADDSKEPEMISECVVNIDEVLKQGEEDEWYELLYKEKYSGEIYLEMTFYSNNNPPVRRNVPRPSVHNFSGPGQFAGSASSSSLNGRSSIPGGLATSGSVSGMSLYIPPYAKPARATSSIPQVPVASSSFADLGLPSGHRRKESLPVPLQGYSPHRPVHTSLSHLSQSQSSTSSSYISTDSLNRPLSALSIGTSLSSRPLPPVAAAPTQTPSAHGYRHSVGGAAEVPWANLMPRSHIPYTGTPQPRPMSTNDAAPWNQTHDGAEQRPNMDSSIRRPVSGQAYAQQSHPYGSNGYAPGPDGRSASPIPPIPSSLLPGGPHLPHHANTYSHTHEQGPSYGHLSPAPPAVSHANSAPSVVPSSAPYNAYYEPSRADLQRVPSPALYPQGPNRTSVAPNDPRLSPAPPFALSAYSDGSGGMSQRYGSEPRQTHQSEAHAYPAYPSELSRTPQPYDPGLGHQAYAYGNGSIPPAPSLSANEIHPAATPAGAYVPWYQQTQAAPQEPPPAPSASYAQQYEFNDDDRRAHQNDAPLPPPVPSRRPVPTPPAPTKPSVGYYPSDELYVQATSEYPPQPQQWVPSSQPQPPRLGSSPYPAYHSAPPTAQYPTYSELRQALSPSPQPVFPSSSSGAPPQVYGGWPNQSAAYGRSPSPNITAQQQSTQYYPPPQPPSFVPQARPRSSSPLPPPPPAQYETQGYHGNPPVTNHYNGPHSRSPSPAPGTRQDWRSYLQSLPVSSSNGPPRASSPQPPPKDDRQWFSPPPSLPASIRPPEGWRSTLPAASEGHQWRG